ncbi:protein OSB2, chloroplastic-like [Corylus avellana]|uniref:protein OSB2, chloroplastic-like n=1 Tax=Corylus avellana TaxID=13451 RepID=UPI001E21DE53|nr:protein OSB2, chloroplastic-like [Corylus avellana]
MNSFLSRALAKTASSRRRFLQHPSLFLQSYAATTKATYTGYSARRKPSYKLEDPKVLEPTAAATTGRPELRGKPAPKVWERPSEIPFQTKVSNSVSLIGKVHIPVQFEASPDGKYWAGTVITQDHEADSSALWIPIIFEGDLAHIAACHLKENDCIHVAGELSADPPHPDSNQGQATMQVIVNSLNFVKGYPQIKKSFTSHKKEISSENSVGEKKGTKAPEAHLGTDSFLAGERKSEDPVLNSWRELLDNPKQWRDYRSSKRSGSVKPRYPDFRSKVGNQALWLDSAPAWVLSELEGLKFDEVMQNKGDESWKDLVENPDKWWDNRLTKTNTKAPDFKHKETGEALWLKGSPTWVLPKLPPLKSKQGVVWRDTLLS